MKRKILGIFFGLCSLMVVNLKTEAVELGQVQLRGAAFQNEVLRLVNIERANNGLSALVLDERLNGVAEIKAEDMATNNYFAHDSPLWGHFSQVFADYGLSASNENLGVGYQTPADVVQGWMGSTNHRANILDPNVTSMGVGQQLSTGVIQGSNGPIKPGTMLWAQVFSTDPNPVTNAQDPLALLVPADELNKLTAQYGGNTQQTTQQSNGGNNSQQTTQQPNGGNNSQQTTQQPNGGNNSQQTAQQPSGGNNSQQTSPSKPSKPGSTSKPSSTTAVKPSSTSTATTGANSKPGTTSGVNENGNGGTLNNSSPLAAAGVQVNPLTIQKNGGTSKIFNSLLGAGTVSTNNGTNANSVNPNNAVAILKNINAMATLSRGTQKGLEDTLNEIYTNNPATASPQISKVTMDLFTESVVLNSGIKDKKSFGFSKWTRGSKTGEMKVYGGAIGGSIDKDETTKFGKLKRDTNIYGGYGLMEYGITDETSLGVAVGGNSSNSKIKGGSKLDGDSFNTTIYSNWTRENFNLTSGLGYQLSSFDMKRNLGGLKFKDSYNTNTYNIFTEARYTYDLGNSLYLEPSLYTSWVHVDQDGVNEKNSTLAMKVNGDSFNYVNIKPGLDLVKDINLASGELELSAGIAYNAVVGDNKSDKMSAAFTAGGSNFDLYVDDIENTFEARAKAQHNLNNGVFYNGGVKYRTGDNTNGIIGELGIGYKF